jgi:hypothetical protein
MNSFSIDLHSLLVQKGLDKELEFLEKIIIKTLYKNVDAKSKEWLESNLLHFLNNVVKYGKDEFSRVEKAYLKIGG